MADGGKIRTTITRDMIMTGIGLGALSWVADAVVDALFFQKGNFVTLLLSPPLSDAFMRFLVMFTLAVFGVYASFIMSRRRKAETWLRETEQRYQSLIETARDVIFTLSAEGVFTSVNPAAETISGWTQADLIGKPFLPLIHPDDLPYALELFRNALQGLTRDMYELRVLSKSGAILTLEFTATKIQNGPTAGILGIVRDITGRKRTEQALRESEARYRDLFENANDLIQSVAADGSLQYVNRAWREALGYTEEEVRRLSLLDVVHPDYREHCTDIFRRVTSGEKLDHVEAMFRTKDGKSVLVEGNINCSFAGGKPVATRGIFRNITERRYAEEFVKNILESVDEGFIVLDRDYRITSANKAYCDKLKLTLQDIIGRHCYEVSHHIAKPCHENGEDCAVRQTFRTGEFHSAVHMHFDREGNPIYIETKAYPLKDSLGRIISVIEIHNDITEKKRLEDQLRHAQKMEAIGTLAGGVAHDFNNILTAIIGYGNLLQMKMEKDDPLRPNVDQILASTERAASLTQSLLAFSRKQAINLRLVDLNSVVKRVEKLLRRLIGEDVEIRIHLTGGGTTVRADAGQMEQVLMNLATNARDAMPQGGVLFIKTEVVELSNEFIKVHGYGKTGRYVLVSATDTGAGMDKKTRERIFEPFFTTKDVGRGTGLGLAIVYGIIKQHGGYINVYSEPDKGTTFRLYFPLIAEIVQERGPADVTVPTGGTATILLAEDDGDVRNLTKAVLEGFGYTVLETGDGEEALAKFLACKDKVQLLILDVVMPKKNGREAYEAIRTVKPDMKVLFMSGYEAEIIQNKGLLAEGVNFLSKPVSPRDLLKKVQDILDDRPAEHPAAAS